MSNEKKNSKLEYWRSEVELLRNDYEHGSFYLARKALEIVEEFVQRQLYRNRTELIQSLSKLSNALIRAKPLMALIYNHTKRVVHFIQNLPKEEKNIQVIRQKTLEEIARIRKQSEQNLQVITQWGARLILDYHVILTHSASQVVESILLEAKRHRKRFRVICTESRPRREGVFLAQRLAKAGIKTRLIPDCDITRALDEAHFVLSGTDRFTETTFINKTGTHAIALIAREKDKPFYVAGEVDKILLKRTYPVRFNSVNPDEILEDDVANLTVENIYFEETPLELVEKIIIENGIFERKEFVDRYL